MNRNIVDESKKEKIMRKHSWPRRSGKTGAAIMKSLETGWKYYSCGFVTDHVKNLPFRADTLRGLEFAVIDNYEFATQEELEIIATLNDCEVFGTFGSDADDYRIPTSDEWKLIVESVKNRYISTRMALKEFNIVDLDEISQS